MLLVFHMSVKCQSSHTYNYVICFPHVSKMSILTYIYNYMYVICFKTFTRLMLYLLCVIYITDISLFNSAEIYALVFVLNIETK